MSWCLPVFSNRSVLALFIIGNIYWEMGLRTVPKAKRIPQLYKLYFSSPSLQSHISWNSSHISIFLVSVPFSDSNFRFFFCRGKNCWEEGTNQLTKTATCCPWSLFSSLLNTGKLLFEKCYASGLHQLCRVPWISWEKACQNYILIFTFFSSWRRGKKKETLLYLINALNCLCFFSFEVKKW